MHTLIGKREGSQAALNAIDVRWRELFDVIDVFRGTGGSFCVEIT